MRVCDREVLVKFLDKKLEEDDRLDFLFHLDACPSCWEEVYNAEKKTHP
ncbi:MAG: zf-HC2 domain-containing protein, partial [bacterium]